MSDEVDYNSESDEDFCPDKLVAGESCSEEEESGDEEEANEEDTDTKKQISKKRTKKANSKKTKKRCKSGSAEDDEESAEISERRSTRQTGSDSNGTRTAAHEKCELESDEEDKSRTDSLWADFLGVGRPLKDTKTQPDKAPGQKLAPSTTAKTNGHAADELKGNCAASPAAKSTAVAAKKVTVTEILDFAGEEVRVQKTIDADSIKARSTPDAKTERSFGVGALKRTAKGAADSGASGPSGGLGSILNQIGKKKKITVLEKTQLDWNNFKQDEGIGEQLQTFNKGKDGYLERQDFLERTDLRQFEIEKNLRQTRRNN